MKRARRRCAVGQPGTEKDAQGATPDVLLGPLGMVKFQLGGGDVPPEPSSGGGVPPEPSSGGGEDSGMPRTKSFGLSIA